MKRLHAAVLFVLGFAAAGAFSGAVIADVTTSTTSSTVATTTTETTTATTATTTTTTTTPATGATLPGRRARRRRPRRRPAPGRGRLRGPGRVSPAAAGRGRQEHDAARPARGSRRPTRPLRLPARASRRPARRCSSSSPCTARHFARGSQRRRSGSRAPPVDASLKLKDGKPFLTKDKPGRALDTARLAERIVAALKANTRLPVRARTRPVAPKVSVHSFAETIVINRSINRLFLYDLGDLRRTFKVATGQAIYPDAERRLAHRRQVEEPDVVSARSGRLGEGPEAGAARSQQPARHTLDGPRRARASAFTAPTSRPRSATARRTAASECRCPRPNGCSTTSTWGRRSTSSDAHRPRRRRSRSPRPARAARLGRRPRPRLGCRPEGRQGQDRPGSEARPAAARRPGPVEPRVAARQGRRRQLLAVGLPPVQAGGEDARRRRAGLEVEGRRLRRCRRTRLQRPGARVPEALRRELRERAGCHRAARTRAGASPGRPRRSSSTGAATSSRRTSSAWPRARSSTTASGGRSARESPRRRRGGARARRAGGRPVPSTRASRTSRRCSSASNATRRSTSRTRRSRTR